MTHITKKALKHPPPINLVLAHIKQHFYMHIAYEIKYCNQIPSDNWKVRARLKPWCQIEICQRPLLEWMRNEFGAWPDNPLIHLLNSHVNLHQDNISNCVRIIPIQVPSFALFVIGDNGEHKSDLEVGMVYEFDDSKNHGIINPQSDLMVLITFDGLVASKPQMIIELEPEHIPEQGITAL